MTAESTPPLKRKLLKKNKKIHLAPRTDAEILDALSWKQSLPVDDTFSLLSGSNEGGFLSLEEIEDVDYRLLLGDSDLGQEQCFGILKSKKRKLKDIEDKSCKDSSLVGLGAEEKTLGEIYVKNKQKRKKKRGKLKKEMQELIAEKVSDDVEDDLQCVSHGDPVFNEDDFHAWRELRLHPLLMKAIYSLGFREPTPIQKDCIPAAAHQGKDVIGAAETGSGKTLAFGLPILQRLLEKQEKEIRLSEDRSTLKQEVQGCFLRALVLTPTRELALQVTDHIKKVARFTSINVVPVVGGMSTEKQERLLRKRPEIIVGTPGRLWELMSGGEQHLVELHSLSFFVLDEADRMIESGHFHELQSIIDMLPTAPGNNGQKRQTFVFSATVALSAGFRKKLKRGSLKPKAFMNDEMSSIENLSERAGMKADAAIFDLTNASIMAHNLEESFIECREDDKEAYLYYLLSIHGYGRTIIFCTSIAALRRLSSLLRILSITVWTLHAQMQQRARLKAVDRFRATEHGVLIATDVAARGLDIPGVRTVVHYQLPHSAEVYVHRSGRTARASADGCCIALISSSDRMKFGSLCKSFSKDTLQRFPVDMSYMPEVAKRMSLARQIDNILRKNSNENARKSWFDRNAESVDLVLEDSDSGEERIDKRKQKKTTDLHLSKLQQELTMHLARPLQPKSFSHRYLAGAGVSPLIQSQLEELCRQKVVKNDNSLQKKCTKLVVIGQDCLEPLQALRNAGSEVLVSVKEQVEKLKNVENKRKRRREEKRRLHEKRRKERKCK